MMHGIDLNGGRRPKKEIKIVPTDCGVANEGFLVFKHGIDSDFLAVLRSDDGNCGLFVGSDSRHLFDDLNLCVLVVDSGESVVLH